MDYVHNNLLVKNNEMSLKFPNTSWDWNIELPDDMCEILQVHKVLPTPMPISTTHKVVEDGFEIIDNKHYKKWKLVELPVTPVSVIKADVWEQIKLHRTKILNGNFFLDGHWYHCNPDSKTEFNTMKLAALERKFEGLPLNTNIVTDGSPVYVKTVDNGYMPITYEKAIQLVEACSIHVKRTYECAAVHQVALNSSSTPLDYNWHTGWQPQYGE